MGENYFVVGNRNGIMKFTIKDTKEILFRCMILLSLFNYISSFLFLPYDLHCNRYQTWSRTSGLSYRTYTNHGLDKNKSLRSTLSRLKRSSRSQRMMLHSSTKSQAESELQPDKNSQKHSDLYDEIHLQSITEDIVITDTQTHDTIHLDATNSTVQPSDHEFKITPKLFNGFLLIACFGFATYAILNVDAGMTRGWSISEKAMRIPLDNWASYESSLNTQPIVTKTTINVIIYLLGDWLSQTVFVKKNVLEFDAFRTLRNGLIGLVFGPLVHEYYEFSDYILPVDVGMNRLYKIFMDQTIYLSVKCSVYIVAVNVLAGESLEYSIQTAKEKILGIMFTAWRFWPLVHCITYGAIPARHRILWVNCVDLFWNAILALKTSSNDDENDEKNNGGIQNVEIRGEVIAENSDCLLNGVQNEEVKPHVNNITNTTDKNRHS